jgi:hypothetical protein
MPTKASSSRVFLARWGFARDEKSNLRFAHKDRIPRVADQPLAHPARRPQIELVGCLGGDEFHRRALHRFGDGFGIAKVVSLCFRIRTHTFRRHQPL